MPPPHPVEGVNQFLRKEKQVFQAVNRTRRFSEIRKPVQDRSLIALQYCCNSGLNFSHYVGVAERVVCWNHTLLKSVLIIVKVLIKQYLKR